MKLSNFKLQSSYDNNQVATLMATFRSASHVILKQSGRQWGSLNSESLKLTQQWTKVKSSSMDFQRTDDFVLADDRLIDLNTGDATKIQVEEGCRLMRFKEGHSSEGPIEKVN